jgi:catechol 2,3-dioxygenase-like lactoylglutathione lyase family enzyme
MRRCSTCCHVTEVAPRPPVSHTLARLLLPASFSRAAFSRRCTRPVSMASPQDAAYRENVVKLATTTDWPPVVHGLATPAVTCLRYHHLGLACRDVAASQRFYAALGFNALQPSSSSAPAKGDGIVVLRGAGGLELHLVQADDCSGSDNVLMDNPTQKAPGHTHCSWKVPSVTGVKTFLEGLGIALSGTRSTLAVFVRDPDRTTLEMERNDGKDEPPAEGFSAAHIGWTQPLDHVGIRTRAPHDRHLEWYARNMGFNLCVRKYEVDADPLKNGSPMITRTMAGVDINFIPNANSSPPAGGEGLEAPLFSGGVLKPGILYAAFTMDERDASAACERLRANGVDAVLDSQLGGGDEGAAWGGFPASAVKETPGHPTVMVRDLNGTVLRLVPSAP